MGLDLIGYNCLLNFHNVLTYSCILIGHLMLRIVKVLICLYLKYLKLIHFQEDTPGLLDHHNHLIVGNRCEGLGLVINLKNLWNWREILNDSTCKINVMGYVLHYFACWNFCQSISWKFLEGLKMGIAWGNVEFPIFYNFNFHVRVLVKLLCF